jgi:hypothetical protein
MVQTGKNRFTGHPKLIYLENQMFLPGFLTIQEWLKVLKGQRKTKIQLSDKMTKIEFHNSSFKILIAESLSFYMQFNIVVQIFFFQIQKFNAT